MDAKLCDCCGKVLTDMVSSLPMKVIWKEKEITVKRQVVITLEAKITEGPDDICGKCRKDFYRKVVNKAMDEMIVRRAKGAKGKSRPDDS